MNPRLLCFRIFPSIQMMAMTSSLAPTSHPVSVRLSSTQRLPFNRPLSRILPSCSIHRTSSKFTNRYHDNEFESKFGQKAAKWLLQRVIQITEATSAAFSLVPYRYRGVSSIIANIPGHSAKTVIIGAHQNINDSGTGSDPRAREPESAWSG